MTFIANPDWSIANLTEVIRAARNGSPTPLAELKSRTEEGVALATLVERLKQTDLAISPGGRPINYSSLDRSPKKNWVERAGGLPKYIRGVARGIAKKHGGDVTSRDIAIAISRMKVWAAGGDNVSPAVQAAAAKALAEWEALKAKSKG